MFKIKCPECKANIKDLVRDYLQWRSDRRICPHCGVQLHISNTIFCFGLCGLIFGILVGSSHYWGLGNKWLSLVTAVLICWMVLPVIVRAVGRWHVLPSEQGDLIKERNWAQIVPVSLSALAIAFGITYCVVRLTFEAVVR